MAEQQKWNNDIKVTATMVEDFMFDPILAAKVILGTKIPPHQELRILMMWTTAFTSDDAGFSTGKSYTIAMIAALRSILFANRVTGILSKTFAQGKLIFANFDKWSANNKRFRWCLRQAKGQSRLIHDNTAHQALFRGGSEIRVLPPAFATDSERLRSERWHDGYFDEWTTIGNFQAFNKTVIGRVSNINEHPNCPVRQNHIHLTSTPTFMHHPSYSMVKHISSMIGQGNTDYARLTSNYRHIPRTKEYEWLVNRKTIFHMQTTLARGMVKAEVDGLWQRDSGTYYNSAIVDKVRLNAIKPVLVRTKKEDGEVFIAAFDTARGGSTQGNATAADDFALSVFRKSPGANPIHALTMRFNGVTERQMSGIIHMVHRSLGLSLIGFDPGGGGLFVRDKLHEPMQIIRNVPTQCTSIVEIINSGGMVGENILVPIKRGSYFIEQMYGSKMGSDSVLVNRIHKDFRDAIETERVSLAPKWEGWDGNQSQWDAGYMREWLTENAGSLSDEDRAKAEMDLAVAQLMLIDIKRTDDGNPSIDSYGMYEFGSKTKKDAAYSLVYAYMMCQVWDSIIKNGFGTGMSANQQRIVCATGAI